MQSITIFECVVGVGEKRKDINVQASSIADACTKAVKAYNEQYGAITCDQIISDVRAVKFKCVAWM